ncbi:MAG: hypothetical protein GAK29_04092 [Acinetobacter bereziniae]|uniref:AAA-ATPase-like domain-containing protein n=1 Tax=Acinetobacter bereziniae TaxID=106648 RepID=A0A833P9P2_ACIBZ|nr:MAG: hypothetical protein GAK29_04092 [Acinetobacter bereziniae]
MLIKELLEGRKEGEDSNVMIFAPSKFGKTVNLRMIRTFCEIEDAEMKTKEDVARDPTMEDLRSNPSKNMRMFLRQFGDRRYEECAILKEENFFIQHFGRHPVVSLDFEYFDAKNDSQAVYYCARQVQRGYEEHKYLRNSQELSSEEPQYIQTCRDWINYLDLKSLSLLDVVVGLKNLIRCLSIHWGRKPVFLVDEIDKPYIQALYSNLSEKEACEMGATVNCVIYSVLRSADMQHLELQAALLTGICKLSQSELSLIENALPGYCLSDGRFSEYYGMTPQEVETLVKRVYGSGDDAEKMISDINARYRGYYQISSAEDKEDTRYCLFSVLSYLNDIKIKRVTSWTDEGFVTANLVTVLQKSVQIRSALEKLLYEDAGAIQIKYERSIDISDIFGLFTEEISVDVDVALNYLLQRGYLTRSVRQPGDSSKILVRIPNQEVKPIFGKMFVDYYRSLPEDIYSDFIVCGDILQSLPMLDFIEFSNEMNTLCGHFEDIFKFMKCQNEHSVYFKICAILRHYAGYETTTKYRVNCPNDQEENRWVVWGRYSDFALIFDIKYNPDATSPPGKIRDNTKTFLAGAEEVVKLLPDKEDPEDRSIDKARALRALNLPQIKGYLIRLAVNVGYSTHMDVFRNTSDWKEAIEVSQY